MPAALAYALGPYLLQYAARISVILLPWAGLPWMIGSAAMALRHRGWSGRRGSRLIIVLVGSMNATSLLLAGIGPALWIMLEVLERRIPWRTAARHRPHRGADRRRLAVVDRRPLGAGPYGVPIFRYTETPQAIAAASTASEVSRGLGYWFEYGGDRVSQWVEPATTYLVSPGLIVLGFALLAVALLGLVVGVLVRRRFFVLLLVVGVGVAVGLNPLSSPSPWGRLFACCENTTAGQAMRSTPRRPAAVRPALAMGLGALVARIAERVPRRAGSRHRSRWASSCSSRRCSPVTSTPPASCVTRASRTTGRRRRGIAMDAGGDATRVYETPGSDFAYYRWGRHGRPDHPRPDGATVRGP